MQLVKRASSKANHPNRCSILNLSKDWTGTDVEDGVAAHKTTVDPLAGTIGTGVGDGVAAIFSGESP